MTIRHIPISRGLLAGPQLGAVLPPALVGAATPGTQLGMPGWSIDLPQGVIYAAGSPIKLVPAIISTLALKLIFFSGNLASTKAKSLLARRKAGHGGEVAPNLVTNPRRSSRRRSRRR